MPDYIAADILRVGETVYIYADRIDIDRLMREEIWSERLCGLLKEHGQLVELTREGFARLAPRRPADAPWPPRGFTLAYLQERGILDPAPVEPKPGEIVTIEIGPDAIVFVDHFIQPKKRGNFTFYDVADAEGRLLRAASFKSLDAAQQFLTELSTGKVLDQDSGAADDSDLQRGSE